MKKFEAQSLEDTYLQATSEFKCSITELEISIVQQPTKGFLGIGRKNAIIVAMLKSKITKDDMTKQGSLKYKSNRIDIKNIEDEIEVCQKEFDSSEKNSLKDIECSSRTTIKLEKKDEIFDKFYTNDRCEEKNLKIYMKKDKEEIINEIKKDINELFSDFCFDLNEIKVELYDEETVYVEFTGVDCALLIGKEGYRYKALSYILFNWINEKYGMMLRLEVAEFLKNQEQTIHSYLQPVIEAIKDQGTYKTKPLDGILIHIALKRLREEFPSKYVAVKTNQNGERYVLINEYKAK